MTVPPGWTSNPLLSSVELGELLGVPVSTVYAWQSRGGGPPAYRVGRHTRYREDEVLAWLERKRRPPQDPGDFTVGTRMTEADAAFIANAPTDIAALLARDAEHVALLAEAREAMEYGRAFIAAVFEETDDPHALVVFDSLLSRLPAPEEPT